MIRWVVWTTFAITGLFCTICGDDIPISVQMEYFGHLLSLSETLFAIVGVWLGVVYPEILTELNNLKTVKEIKSKSLEFKRLVYPSLASLLSIAAISCIRFFYLFKGILPIKVKAIPYIRMAGISAAYILTIGLLVAFFFTLAPLATMHCLTDQKSELKQEIIERNKLVQKSKKQ